MADKKTVEELADASYALLLEYHGKKRFKPRDLQKELESKFGKSAVEKKTVKKAIALMMEDGRTKYGYAGSSWIEPLKKEEE